MATRGAAGGSSAVPNSKTLGLQVWTGDYGADYTWTLPLRRQKRINGTRGVG